MKTFLPSFLTGLIAFSSLCAGSVDLNRLSIEEKVGQLLMVSFLGESPNAAAEALITELHVGGVIYYNWANGLRSPLQVKQLSQGLKQIAKESASIPLFITVDQEGGVVTRLEKGFMPFPGNGAIGRAGNFLLAKEIACAMGSELQAVGINMNLAPCIDINSNSRNPVIGIRALSDLPEEVARLGAWMLEGYKQAGMISTLKHFPGHGDTTVDSHIGLPCVEKSREELEACEWIPFRRLVGMADCIMTAHVMLPLIDVKNPGTFSKPILDILRHDMGFQGVIISDSLVMQGAAQNQALEQRALAAFQAGCDILLFGGRQLVENQQEGMTVEEIRRIRDFLVTAVHERKIHIEQLNASVTRILELKEAYGILGAADGREDSLLQVNTKEHRALAKEVADSAITIEKGAQRLPLDVAHQKIAVFMPSICQKQMEALSLKGVTYPTFGLDAEKIGELLQDSKESDLFVLFTYNAWKSQGQIQLAEELAHLGKPLICIALRDPEDSTLLQKADVVMTTMSPSALSIQAALDNLNLDYEF